MGNALRGSQRFAGQTVQLRVEAADAGSASLIEAGIGNIVITRQ